MDTAVGIVKAYLELCGYFVLAELPIRTADRDGYRDVTDVDILAVRFPHPFAGRPRRGTGPLDVFLGIDPALGTLGEGVDVIVGEVKEGRAHLNPALRRAETLTFALRRLGCCPEAEIPEAVQAILRAGRQAMVMPGQVRCQVRIVVFAGIGAPGQPGVHSVPLAHCTDFIGKKLRDAGKVLAGTHFKDPVLGLFALQEKLTRADKTEAASS